MESLSGIVMKYWPEKSYGFVKNQLTGDSVFFHKMDWNGARDEIQVYARVQYSVIEYTHNGEIRTKAINITPQSGIETQPRTSGGE